eukprot:1161059-Pelagomonas_calceolata.AAC.1
MSMKRILSSGNMLAERISKHTLQGSFARSRALVVRTCTQDTDYRSKSPSGEMAGVHNGVGEVYAPFVRGAALCLARNGSTNLCFGSSSGTLYVSEVSLVLLAALCLAKETAAPIYASDPAL